jgi:hypothetical protein
MVISRHDLQNWFSYHPPADDKTRQAYEEIRAMGYQFGVLLTLLVPPGPDQSAAIRKLREVVMTANAGIACAEPPT